MQSEILRGQTMDVPHTKRWSTFLCDHESQFWNLTEREGQASVKHDMNNPIAE